MSSPMWRTVNFFESEGEGIVGGGCRFHKNEGGREGLSV
jgi:hypothetical protein